MSNFFSTNGDNKNFFGGASSDNLFTENSAQKANKYAEDRTKPLDEQYNAIKDNYQEIFIKAAESIRRELDSFKPENPCANCSHKDCTIEKKEIFSPFPPTGCKYRDWQMQALTYLNGDYRQKLKAEYKAIMDKKENYECNRCAACCKLAVSPYSYEQLKQRANRGDKFSADFVSVFVPYKSEEEARSVNPEYFALLNKLVEDKTYYYYCPKLEGNLCSIYENRPNICKDFPHNPLKLLPAECSFNEWKDEVAYQAMLLNAKVDIIKYYKDKLG